MRYMLQNMKLYVSMFFVATKKNYLFCNANLSSSISMYSYTHDGQI